MKTIITLAIMAGLVGIVQSFSAEATGAAAWQQSLSKVAAPELPAKAADLVKATKASDRGAATEGIVKTAVAINPVAAPAIVAAIAKAAPDMAAIAAGAAAQMQPKQASEIARAAAVAAPAKAGKIVAAVCRTVPQSYRNIALAVAQAVPGAGKDILRALASVFPGMKPGIDTSLASYGYNPPSVATVLDSAKPAIVSSTPNSSDPSPLGGGLPRGPSIAPPYIPLSGTATNVTPSTSGNVPRGGRNYASP